MAWFSRLTRFGDFHMVFGQEGSISCGVACVIMAAFKINKLTPGVRSMFSEADVLARATALLGPNPLSGGGLAYPQMLQLLNAPEFQMPGWKFNRLSPADVPSKIAREIRATGGIGPTVQVKPMIVFIDWKGGGHHWVLVDTVRAFMGNKYATVCDPWDANVHVVPLVEKHSFSYTGDHVGGVDMWGTHFNYDSPSVGGAFVGDVLWRA